MLRVHPRQTNVDGAQQSLSLHALFVEDAHGQSVGGEGSCGYREVHGELLPVRLLVVPLHLWENRGWGRVGVDGSRMVMRVDWRLRQGEMIESDLI